MRTIHVFGTSAKTSAFSPSTTRTRSGGNPRFEKSYWRIILDLLAHVPPLCLRPFLLQMMGEKRVDQTIDAVHGVDARIVDKASHGRVDR